MYAEFLKICEAKLLPASISDALYLYAKIDFMKLASPALHKFRKNNKFEIDILYPIPSNVGSRLPKFKGEDEYTGLMRKAPKINPVHFEDKQNETIKLDSIRNIDRSNKKFRNYPAIKHFRKNKLNI
jgi:hypothetical protein